MYRDTNNDDYIIIPGKIRATIIVTEVLKKHLDTTTGKHSSTIITKDT
jgi:hypothetical protein